PAALAEAEARLTFLCNPNSPSGTLVPVSEVARLAERIAGLLVVDEAYVDFAREHALGLVGRCPNVVVLRTLSKSFSLAGLRVVKDSYNVNRLSQVAGEAALADLATMRANVGRVCATRAVLAAGL